VASGPSSPGITYIKPVCRATRSARFPDGPAPKIHGMDAISIALGIAMFAILFGLIYAIDRV
jgi:hypothetical protein